LGALKNVFLNFRIQVLLLAALIIAFWYPVCFNNEFFYDDWEYINTFQNNGANFAYFLKPINEHFMPLSKLIFFMMFKSFNLNIFPYMIFTVLFHVLLCFTVLSFFRLVFGGEKISTFLLALFFALNTTYYEVLHWFSSVNFSLVLFFLVGTLFLFHKAFMDKSKKMYILSLITSFFVPMNFSMGFLGIVFLFLYSFWGLKDKGSLSEKIKRVLPYFFVWIVYLVFYLIFSLQSILNKPETAPDLTFNLIKILSLSFLGFLGMLLKLFGFNFPLVFPYTIGLTILLIFVSLVFALFSFLYFVLNKKFERIPFFAKSKMILFAFTSIFLCYVVLGITRGSLGAGSIMGWGRYHYFPLFFLSFLLGAVYPRFIAIFSKIFNERRLKFFLLILFIIFLLNNFILIRQKSESPIRTEGKLPAAYFVV